MGTGAGRDATTEHADADLWSDFLKGEAKISTPWLNLEANQVDADEGGEGCNSRPATALHPWLGEVRIGKAKRRPAVQDDVLYLAASEPMR